jgi:hypothetical protein
MQRILTLKETIFQMVIPLGGFLCLVYNFADQIVQKGSNLRFVVALASKWVLLAGVTLFVGGLLGSFLWSVIFQ